MIYILTPSPHDFELICYNRKLKKGHDVLWVDKPERLYGRKIHKEDIIINGDKFHLFSTETINRFEVEIALRKRF